MEMNDQRHYGRKEILSFFTREYGIVCWDTVREWKRNGYPIRYTHKGRPFIIESEAILFQIKVSDATLLKK